jgi:hypothetical protein
MMALDGLVEAARGAGVAARQLGEIQPRVLRQHERDEGLEIGLRAGQPRLDAAEGGVAVEEGPEAAPRLRARGDRRGTQCPRAWGGARPGLDGGGVLGDVDDLGAAADAGGGLAILHDAAEVEADLLEGGEMEHGGPKSGDLTRAMACSRSRPPGLRLYWSSRGAGEDAIAVVGDGGPALGEFGLGLGDEQVEVVGGRFAVDVRHCMSGAIS